MKNKQSGQPAFLPEAVARNRLGSPGRRRRLTFFAVLSAIGGGQAFVQPASGQIFPINDSGYRIIEAPTFQTGHSASARGFQWIDAGRLLFVANDRELSLYDTRGGRRVMVKAVPTIHLWDIHAGTIKRYRDEPLADHLCAADARVWYGVKREDRTIVFGGPYEKERELGSKRLLDDGTIRRLNPYTCKEYRYADLPRMHGGRTIPLREEHGSLERSGATAVDEWLPPFMWWNHTTSGSKEVPFPQNHISDPLGYSFIANGYLFRKDSGRVEIGMTNRFYLWVPKSNTTRTLDIPGSGNWAVLQHATLTGTGLVAISSLPSKERDKRDPGPAGVYLFSGSPVEKFIAGRAAKQDVAPTPLFVEQIIRGVVEEVSGVSPDGCLIATVVDPWNAQRTRARLLAIDVCRKGG